MKNNNLLTNTLSALARLPLIIVLVALAATALTAQEANDDEQVFELSPFTVDGSTDVGYMATQTLSGGRMRTNLSDVANQVEVLTQEFLNDWDLNTIDQALTYTINVEGAEEFTDANNARYSTGTETFGRIRGLGSAANATGSRNFFLTNTRMDGYNIDRIEIAAGPNAILFGLGNPGGMLASQIKQARLAGRNPDRGELEVRFDSEGSFGADIDYNKVLIDDILAFRFAGTHKDLETSRKPNFYEDDRWYVTTTFRPFGRKKYDNTSIRLHYERVQIDNSRAPNKVVFDQATPFFVNGGGIPFDNRGTLRPNNRTNFFNPLPGYLIDDRNASTYYVATPGNAGTDATYFGTYGWAEVLVPTAVPSNGISPLDDFRWSLPVEGEYGDLYPVDLNWTGDTYLQKHDSEVFTAFFEQKIMENMFLEVAYNEEMVDKKSVGYYRGGDFRIFVDPNQYMPLLEPDRETNEELNPNAGQLYLEGIPTGSLSEQEETELRASLIYEFDFKDHFDSRWITWLGRHQFGLLYQDRESLRQTEDYFAKVITPEVSFLPARAQQSNGNPRWGVLDRNFVTRQYLNDSNPVATMWANFWEPVDLVYPGTGETFTVGVHDAYGPQREPIGEVIGVESNSFNWMGHFLDGNLILSYGERQDDLKKKLYIDDGLGNTGPEGAWLPYSAREFGDWVPDESGTTKAKGAVLRPLGLMDWGDWLSVFWYESNNFNPNLKDLNPLNHERVGANRGVGEDYGFRIAILRNKHRLDFSWNWFENSDEGAPVSNAYSAKKNDLVFFDRAVARTYNLGFDIVDEDDTVSPYNDYLVSQGVEPLTSGINTYTVIGDTVAEGQEWSLNYNYGGFALRVTLAKNETVSANIGQNWIKWESLRRPVWDTMQFKESSDDTTPVGWEQAIDPTEGRTLKELYDAWVTAQALSYWEASNGAAVQSLPKYRANINMRYAFNDGVLDGFTAGIAARWRDSAALGYYTTILNEGTPEAIEISDINSPVMGPDSLLYDAFFSYQPGGEWLWFKKGSITFQLNIRNLFNEERIEPIKASSDGVYRVFMYNEPRTFSFTTRFTF